VRGDVEGCRHASRAADARRSASGVPATRSCSAPATDRRERTYARHDRASHLEAPSRRVVRGSSEASESRGHATSQRPQAPAPYGSLAGLFPNRPNHFRILADRLRVTCISTSLPPPSAQWPVRSTRKERLGKRNGSRSPRPTAPASRAVHAMSTNVHGSLQVRRARHITALRHAARRQTARRA
jgi:hypothetical protein